MAHFPKKETVCIGECMIEMAPQNQESFRLNFAGDTLNTAIYLSRFCEDAVNVHYVTAVGDDPFSTRMLHYFNTERIQGSLIRHIPGQLPGLYLIQNDSRGERTFYYYRAHSPARGMFDGEAGDNLCQRLLTYDALYLSGITLGILYESGRNKLLVCLKEAYKKNKLICFDSNFRKSLWPDLCQAKKTMQTMYACTSIALPSFDDECSLFSDPTPQSTAERLNRLGVPEIIVKQGESGYFLWTQQHKGQISVKPEPKAIDTTGAGDAFNGVYLAHRLQDILPDVSAKRAAQIAAEVTRYHGAIMPRTNHCMKDLR